jgi:hypothetical protein
MKEFEERGLEGSAIISEGKLTMQKDDNLKQVKKTHEGREIQKHS